MEETLIGLVSIIVLGIGAQWLAWKIHLPSILLLLLFGFLAGPISGILLPSQLMGPLLFPMVSLSVAIILFEGGLNLKLSELPKAGGSIRNLISIGAFVTMTISTLAAQLLLDLSFSVAVLLGAILVVTGPTVILPMLRHIRPVGTVGPILRWEGIIIDPIGAMLAVLVFEAIAVSGFQSATTVIVVGVLKTLLIGTVAGLLAAGLLTLLMKRYWVPDHLENPVSLMLVVTTYYLANWGQHESGLLAVTVMGVAMANQRYVSIEHIIEFKENLQILLLSALFILLAARLKPEDINYISGESMAFLLVLVLVARPFSVVVSTIGCGLTWKERIFLSWMAPRGIVAAAVSAVFAFRLAEAGVPGAEMLVPYTFMVIVGTILIYGLTASPLARWLKVAKPNPQGVLIAGAQSWARSIATALQANGFTVLLTDTNWSNISRARMAGLPTYYGNLLSRNTMDSIELDGIGKLLAITSNDEVNSLAALHFAEVFGRSGVFQLAPEEGTSRGKDPLAPQLRGRLLFGQKITYRYLQKLFSEGAQIRTTRLTKEFDQEKFKRTGTESAIPLFLIERDGNLYPFAIDDPPTPRTGTTVISLVQPRQESDEQLPDVHQQESVAKSEKTPANFNRQGAKSQRIAPWRLCG